MLDKRFLVSVAACLWGCLSNVVPLHANAEKVQLVHDTDRPLRCKVLGKISGTSRSDDLQEARKGAQNDFRNHAADLQGNFALAEAERGNKVGTGSSHDFFIGGKALLCETEEMEEAREKREAAASQESAGGAAVSE